MRQRIIKARAVQRLSETVVAGPDAIRPERAAGADAVPAAIELRREGGRVAAIAVDCPCGRHLEFQCVYDAADAATPSAPPS